MKALIISGTGWIGHQVVRMLTEAGYEVAVTSRGTAAQFPLPEATQVFVTQRTDFHKLDCVMKQWQPQIVMDMIPQSGDIRGIIDVCKRYLIKHYLHCSSTGVYMPLEYIPADEDHPWDRETDVNFTFKVEVDRTALDACRNDGFPATVIRPSYIQGEGKLPLDGLGGRYPEYWRRVFAGKSVPVPGNGEMLLHPVLYQDVASAFLRALSHPDKSIGQAYIVTGDKAVTLGRYIEGAIKAAGSSSTIEYLPIETYDCDFVDGFDRESGGFRFLLEHMCLNNAKAKHELDWDTSADLEEGLRRTIDWSKANL